MTAKKPTIKQQGQPAMRGVKAVEPYDDRPLNAGWVSASVIQGEDASSRYNNNTGRDFELVARARLGTPAHACGILANVCSSQTLRLYRRAARGAKRYASRAVTDRKTLKYLRGDGEVRPTACKGANYASKAGDGIEEVLDSPILSVLQNPDPVYCGQLWMKLLWWQREACGRSYIWAGDRVGGIPTSLYLLPSAYTWPVKSRTGLISEFIYARNRSDMFHASTDDVVYIRSMPDPFDPVGALSWLQSVTAEADMEAAALTAEVARWNNGGHPGMVFKAGAQNDNTQMMQMRSALENQIRGVGKAGNFLLLRDTELVQYATKPHEMQYIQGMEATQKRIYDAAGIPEPIYRLNSANLASATVADAMFAKLSIAPRLATMASELTEGLLPLFGVEPGEMWFSYDNPVRDDVVLLAAELRAAELQGIIYPNEYRHILDLEALPDEMNVLRFRQTEAPPPMFDPFSVPAKVSPAAEAEMEDDTEENAPDEEDDAEGNTDDTVTKSVTTKADSYEPTDSMAEEAQRGLDWREEFGRGGTEIGVARARDISNKRGLSLDTVYRMASYFARHEVDKQGQGWSPDQDGYPSAGRIAWALWGGDPGRTWAEKIVKQVESDDDTDPSPSGGKSVGSSVGACECVSCGKGGSAVLKSANDTAAAGGNRGSADVRTDGHGRDGIELKAMGEWDEDANVPKSTVRIFNEFANKMNTWYMTVIPSMVNDTAGVDPPTVKQMQDFTNITDDFIAKTLQNGAAVGIAQIPGATADTFNTANEPAMQYIRDRGLELATSVPETLVGTVQAAIEKELADGTSTGQMRDAIAKAAPELSGYQAERIARTETTNAFNQGALQSWKEAGVQGKRWILAGGPCPECEGLAAKYPGPIPIDDLFEYGGVSVEHPVLHPNCRCSYVPVLEMPQ
jgi:SPP1 gp7 family putative phage head morphogenesis protein